MLVSFEFVRFEAIVHLKHHFSCHRSVLASASPILESLMKEAVEDEDIVLVFTDMSNDELELLISFLYTGFVTFGSWSQSQRFKNLINQLGIEVPTTSSSASSGSEPSEEDDLSTLMVDDFGQSTVDQSEILYEFQANHNVDEVNRILAEIMEDYEGQRPYSPSK